VNAPSAAGRPDLVAEVGRPDLPEDTSHPVSWGTPLQGANGRRVPLFRGEPARDDAEQGILGDFMLICTFGAVAGHRLRLIRDAIRETADGNYEVRLHETVMADDRPVTYPTGRRIRLTVTPDLPVFAADPSKPAVAQVRRAAWSAILEKAFAGLDQIGDVETSGVSGYERYHRPASLFEQAETLTRLTGLPARGYPFPESSRRSFQNPHRRLLDRFRELLAARKPIFVSPREQSPGRPLPKGLIDGHSYEVIRVDSNGMIQLRNPYTTMHPDPLTAQELKSHFENVYVTFADPGDLGAGSGRGGA
jgi:hypothetical protein